MSFNSPLGLTRRAPQRAKRSFLIGAIDTETDGLGGAPLLFQCTHENSPDVFISTTADELLEHVFSHSKAVLAKTIWYSHNAEYDWRYLMAALRNYKDKYNLVLLERMTGKFFQIDVVSNSDTDKRGRPVKITSFRDSMAVYSEKLADFTKAFAPQYAKEDIGLSFKRFDPTNPTHIAYARNDVLGLVEAIKNFDHTVYQHYGVHIRGTFASTSFQAWLRTIPEGEYHNRQTATAEAFFRKCYYGGLVQLNAGYQREYHTVSSVDINSSYPYTMRKNGVPKGKPVTTLKYMPGFPGFYHVTATVPDDAIFPIVPHRSDNGMSLAWERGTYETYLSSMEIDHCSARGCSFDVHGGYYFPEGIDYCFTDFVNKAEKLRGEYRKTPTEIVVKFMQNSLYGRFGMKPEGREYIVTYDETPEGYMPFMDNDGRFVPDIYFKNTVRDNDNMLPHYAAWITAGARINIDLATEAGGRENALYRDTDSISFPVPFEHWEDTQWVPPGLLDAGLIDQGRYGALKRDKTMFEAKFHAPKCYTYKNIDGEYRATYKGIPHKFLDPRSVSQIDPNRKRKLAEIQELLHRLHNGERIEVEYSSQSSLQTFEKTGKLTIIRRRSSTMVSKVYGHVIENGKFRPRRAG